MTKFQISTRYSGRLRTVKVLIYDDLDKMRRDASHYCKRIGTPDDCSDVMGVAHSFEIILVGSDGTEIKKPEAGIIRLWKKELRAGLVTHEVAHIACAIYDQDWAPQHGGTKDCIENEEVFCDILGSLTGRLVDAMARRECC